MDKSSISIPNNKISSEKVHINLLNYIDSNIIIFSLIGFLLSRSILIGSIAPLGIAFFLGIVKIERYRIPVFISTLGGIILSGNSTPHVLKYIVCLAIFMIISNKIKNVNSYLKLACIGAFIIFPISIGQVMLSDKYVYDILLCLMEGIITKIKNVNSYLKLACIGAFIIFPISIGQVMLSDKYVYDILLCLMEGIITFISVYIFSFGINLLTNINNRVSVRVEESIALSFIVIFSIIGIGNIEILGISVQTVLATILIITTCIVGGPTMGASSGVVVGIAFLINNISSAIYMGIYAVAGLIGGTLNKLSKYFAVLGYVLSWAMVYAYTSGIESNVHQIRDILIASLIVILLPNKIFDKIEKLLKLNIESNDVVYDYIKRSKDMTNVKLLNMYKAYDELADTFDKIREKDKVIDTRDIASIVISSAIYMGIYAVAGLIGGTLNKLSKYFAVLGYVLSWAMVYAYTSGIESNVHQIRDILIASLIVILLPNKIFDKIEKLLKLNIESNDVVYDYIKRSKDMTNVKLLNMYKAYDELADTFDKIREKDKVIDTRDIASIVDMIHNDECRNCSMRRRCWDLNFTHTYTLMSEILEELEDNGEVTIDSVSVDFRKECLKPEQIVKVANYYYKLFLVDYNWSLRFSESRKLIANQIKSISRSIESLSKDLEGNIVLDLEKEKNIYDQLQRCGINVNRVSYMSKGKDDFEITIEKNTCRDGCMCEKKLIKILSDVVDEDITAQKIGCHSLGGKCKISFTKAQKYKAITEVAGMSRDGHILCGDNYTYMDISDGKYMVAISDGMGKGKKAYEESYITIDILEKMMDAKIDDEIVINTINNMLLLKSSDEEMFSTLDLGIIDLKKGTLETIKMGACSTYIKRNNEDIDLISSSSLPVGILSDIKLDRKTSKIKYGDYVIMVSDGILDAGKNNNLGDNWLIYFLQKINTTNPKEIANEILDRALEIQDGVVEDDMTVLVTKICSN